MGRGETNALDRPPARLSLALNAYRICGQHLRGHVHKLAPLQPELRKLK